MKVGPQTVSAVVHLGLLGAVVFLVKTEARLPTAITAFISGEQEEKAPPPPPPPAPVAAPAKARGARPSGPPRAAAAPAQQPSPQAGSGAGAPPMDLGLLEADDGEGIPEGAVVVAAPVAEKVAPVRAAPPPPPVVSECTEDPTSPEPVTRADVDYPPGLAGMAGRVLAKALISAEGVVTAVEIVGSLDPAIDQAVKDSLLRWRFRPAKRCQKAVAGAWTLALSFEHSE